MDARLLLPGDSFPSPSVMTSPISECQSTLEIGIIDRSSVIDGRVGPACIRRYSKVSRAQHRLWWLFLYGEPKIYVCGKPIKQIKEAGIYKTVMWQVEGCWPTDFEYAEHPARWQETKNVKWRTTLSRRGVPWLNVSTSYSLDYISDCPLLPPRCL